MSSEAAPDEISKKDNTALVGFTTALSAYLLWGFLPLYMKLLEHIPAIEVVAHRILWSVPVAAVILVALGRTGDLIRALKEPKILGMMFFTATLISVNWGVYIWSISANIASQAALGYYINPLMSIMVGVVLLGERLSRLQVFSVLLATTAVIVMTVSMGALPWVSMVLAISFTFYGYLRKTVAIGPTQGFLLEVLLLSPLALAYLVWLSFNGESHFNDGEWTGYLLAGTGVATAFPLILYAAGAKRLKLSTIGLMQYIAPTMIFITAVFVFNEPMTNWQLAAFTLIWTALAIFSFSVLKERR